MVVKLRSIIVSVVSGVSWSPGLSGCRCLYLIRVAYTWNLTVRRDQHKVKTPLNKLTMLSSKFELLKLVLEDTEDRRKSVKQVQRFLGPNFGR